MTLVLFLIKKHALLARQKWHLADRPGGTPQTACQDVKRLHDASPFDPLATCAIDGRHRVNLIKMTERRGVQRKCRDKLDEIVV